MARIELWYDQDLDKPVEVRSLGNLYNRDANSHLIGVRCFRNGSEANLSGSANGYCIINDGMTIPVIGTVSGNTAYFIIPPNAYIENGPIRVSIKLTDGNDVTTLMSGRGNVVQSRTETQIDPGATVTDWTNQIASALQEVEDASAAQDVKIHDIGDVIGDITENVIYVDFTSNRWYTESSSVITNPEEPTAHSGFKCIKIPCSEGDIFNITGIGGTSSHRLYAFTDSSYNVLSVKASSGEVANNKKITAPTNAEYLFCNFNSSAESTLIGNKLITDRVNELDDWTESQIPFKYIGNVNDLDLDNFTIPGWYTWTSSHVPTHAPWTTAKGGRLFIVGDGSGNITALQIVVSVEDTPKVYIRRKSSAQWDGWVKISLNSEVQALTDWVDSEIPFKGGNSANDLDLNDIVTPGWYVWTSSHVPDNTPDGIRSYGGRLFVFGDNNTNVTVVQIAIIFASTPRLYIRTKSSGGWNEWANYIIRTPPELPGYTELSQYFDEDDVISHSIYMDWNLSTEEDRPIVVSMETKYTGETKPQIYFQCFATSGNRVHSSCRYMFQSSTEYIRQGFRVPNGFMINRFRIYISIPEGSTLSVRSFSCNYESAVRQGTGNVIFHAHRGADKIYPPGSYNGIVAAAQLGFQSCIGIPKFTSDGVAVEFHDDGNISSAMAQTDGSAIPSEYNKRIDQLTYNELMQFSIGSPVDSVYAGAKIVTMDDFLRICAETGMRPIFSIHSARAPSVAQWQQLKELTDKYGLTKYLSVKTGAGDVCGRVLNTFGNGGLYSIILLYTGSSTDNILDRIATWVSDRGLDTTKTRLDCEFYEDALFDESTATFQQGQLQAARNAGYVISAVLQTGSSQTTDGTRALMNLGVTEFTDARMYSMGLNW